jgi:hypothetical protein
MHSPVSYTYRQLAALSRLRHTPKIWALAVELKGVLNGREGPPLNEPPPGILPVALNTGATRPVLPGKETGVQCMIDFCIILN